MPAATSAPNANARISSVSGSENSIDLPISSPDFSATALVMLASPDFFMRSSGCAS